MPSEYHKNNQWYAFGEGFYVAPHSSNKLTFNSKKDAIGQVRADNCDTYKNPHVEYIAKGYYILSCRDPEDGIAEYTLLRKDYVDARGYRELIDVFENAYALEMAAKHGILPADLIPID